MSGEEKEGDGTEETEGRGGRGEANGLVMDSQLSARVIGLAVAVHRVLGPGLLESVYEECLCHELRGAGVGFERQKAVPLKYRGVRLECGFRVDVLVEQKLVVEIKSVARILPVHGSQMLTYLRLTGCAVGLLINFDVPVLKDGLRRFVRTTNNPAL